jgi:hypothetical protein
MKIQKLLVALLPFLALAATKAGPTAAVHSDRVQAQSFVAGQRIAWAGMIGEPVGNLERVRIVRGVSTADANGEVSIPEEFAERAHSVWLLSNLDQPGPGHSLRIASNGEADAEQIAVTVGTTSISVEAAAIDLTYVKQNGDAFYFFGADGSLRDADGVQNGTIVIALTSLLHYQTDPHDPSPPAPLPTVTQTGDRLLYFDIYEWREGDQVIP